MMNKCIFKSYQIYLNNVETSTYLTRNAIFKNSFLRSNHIDKKCCPVFYFWVNCCSVAAEYEGKID